MADHKLDRQPSWVEGVARAVVPAPVERQGPRCLAGQARSELDLPLVHGEMSDAAPEL